MRKKKNRTFGGAWRLGRRDFLLGTMGAAAAACARVLGDASSGKDVPSTDRSVPVGTPGVANLSDHEAAFYRPLWGRGNNLAG
jgi:hypothetical protein